MLLLMQYAKANIPTQKASPCQSGRFYEANGLKVGTRCLKAPPPQGSCFFEPLK